MSCTVIYQTVSGLLESLNDAHTGLEKLKARGNGASSKGHLCAIHRIDCQLYATAYGSTVVLRGRPTDDNAPVTTQRMGNRYKCIS
jgi:hypothetical protein